MPAGRPSLFTPELANEICDRIAEGSTLKDIAKDEAMPSRRTITYWLRDNPEFCAQCARARVAQADAIEDNIHVTLDSVAKGDMEPDRARVILNSLQWLAMKANPRRFGDKVELEHSGEVKLVSTMGGNA